MTAHFWTWTLSDLNSFSVFFPPLPWVPDILTFCQCRYFLLHKLRWAWQISRALSLFFLFIKYKFYSAFYAGLKNSRKILGNFYIALRVQKKKQGPVSLLKDVLSGQGRNRVQFFAAKHLHTFTLLHFYVLSSLRFLTRPWDDWTSAIRKKPLNIQAKTS